jgi:3-oxosteroid 1-dehydrogenase
MKGRPRTDADGRVLAAADSVPIPRLFAAGNVAPSAFGLAYPGAGSTLGQGLFIGVRAGRAAAQA